MIELTRVKLIELSSAHNKRKISSSLRISKKNNEVRRSDVIKEPAPKKRRGRPVNKVVLAVDTVKPED